MARNKVMKLWNVVVTAFLALFTALGLITTSASAAVPQTEPARNSTAQPTVPTMSPWSRSHARSLPPTMKQRIRAEAHGKSPSCRHRPLTETDQIATAATTPVTAAAEPAEDCEAEPPTTAGHVSIPLQR
ncbi:DUF6344 domain-containing protein [Streptomyces chromofuscus]|uniref:Secreted protein n=1 Tax=Streptomyces chromofuscus TaxID=42881 RepID=A0A7M2SZR6_STRCW|nr:DUF6344 domain-containing protein [Streptomyces chromofuscus]QOV41887.1 hypothetical protein IPT68_18485 [Streptomyces chromofuscus]GGS87520.1 hypothetical protein GCM10010254_04200 [Streptomyces chromofuscus]